MRTVTRAAALALAVALVAPLGPAEATESPGVAFRVRTLVGPDGARYALSDATVDGPPGTDVTLESRAGSFTMHTTLKTDLLPDGRVRVVAKVTTRRDAGTSERRLPLFEEDVRDATVELATDGSESLVVLPFGRNPGGDELAVDVEPRRSTRPATEPLAIRIDDPGADGWMRIDARTVPHQYSVEASLERDGTVVASGSGTCELDEPGAIALVAPDGSRAAAMRLTVEDYEPACPSSRVGVEFNLDGPNAPVARGWSGRTTSDRPLVYPLGPPAASVPGNPTALRIRVAPRQELQ
jgi:hypothetical protein